MKKSKKIVVLLIALCVIVVAFVGGNAYAKYMSKVTGQGTANIASWNFKVNEKEEQIQKISLESTMDDSKIVNKKIAPGTAGQFQIKIDSTGSEVGVNYVIKFENETQKPTNLKYTYNGRIYNSLSELQTDLIGTINANDEVKTKILEIGWNWKYETGNTRQEITANDLIDTQEAKQIDKYNFDIIVSGTQVDPQN